MNMLKIFKAVAFVGFVSIGGASLAMAATAPGSKAADAALAFDPFTKTSQPASDGSLTLVAGSDAVKTPALVGVTNSPLSPLPGTTVSVADAIVREAKGGYSALVFFATLSKPSPVAVTVQYRSIQGTAKAGLDYETAIGTLTFPPNSQREGFSVRVLSDSIVEPTEYLTVEITNPKPSPVTIARGTAKGTVLDEDKNPPKGPKLTLASSSSPTVTEGNAGTKSIGFKVYLSETPTSNVTYQYSTQERTASAYGQNPDYVAFTKEASFAKGTKQLTNTFSVTINGDKIKEANEYFDIELREPVNASIAYGVGRVYIQNDD